MLQAAEQNVLQLLVPVYCLTEVFQTLGSRRIERLAAEQFVRQEMKQHLRETGVVTADMERLGSLLRELLLARTKSQTASLFATTERISRVATLLPLITEVLVGAKTAQRIHTLTPQNALVYA
ncbi:hypothetical protein [Hymenobacter cavernae]|uniref:hypothetical protein n=1 Tax=Hymenobacter cavernae TaxID=2044852 RepID=UPI00166A8DE1|nr:hypothetical protein [Hymenobacter cavernae]